MSHEDADEIIRKADYHGDGKLRYEEFVAMMMGIYATEDVDEVIE